MGYITKDCYDMDIAKIEFVGWTNFEDPNYKDFSEALRELKGTDAEIFLANCMHAAEESLKWRLKENGIKFDGRYHQNGEWGVPVYKVWDFPSYDWDKFTGLDKCNGIYKWTCTMRYWGEVMVKAGHGKNYLDWAWENLSDPVHPNEVEGEPLLKNEIGVVTDAYDPESDGPLG